jgi:alpha-beta hydrolase superfamily lysophospholipase
VGTEHSLLNWKATDSVVIKAQRWAVEGGDCAGVICIVHGLGEHCGRYETVAEYFNDLGYSVLSYDLRGHGQSPGKRGHAPSYETLLSGVERLLHYAACQYPGRPRILWGQSLGGNIVMNYALRHNPDIAGVIATSPWLALNKEPVTIQRILLNGLRRVWPSFTVRTRINAADISQVPEEVAAYRNDPLNHDRISLAMYAGCSEAGRWAINHAADFPAPLLLMHGTADKITSLMGSRAFMDRAPAHCTYQEWDSLYHELYREPEQENVLASMARWMEKIVAGAV